MIYRSKLDDFLIKMAINNKSIQFIDNISINNIDQDDNTIIFKEKNAEQKINYDILVGAWGSNRQLNRLIDIFPFESYAVSSTWEGPAGPRFAKYSDEYAVCQILKGYPGVVSYIFSKSDMITAGLFTSLNSIKNLKTMFTEFLDFWKLDKKIKPKYALIPIRNYNKPIARDNILLVGDAAGLADPFTGEGIYYAFVSSMIACENINNYFKNKNYDLAFEYNRDIYQNLYDIHKWGKIYEFSFQHLPNTSFWSGSEFYIGNEILNSFITGEIRYYEISKIVKYFFKRIFS
jgi:flavin-dependent dehydrogenase